MYQERNDIASADEHAEEFAASPVVLEYRWGQPPVCV